jgi:tRNA(Ile)-lysidine synthase
MKNNTLRRARETIERYSMIEPGSTVLAAVSGGADSVALLYLLAELRKSLNFDLSVAHLNHSLRGAESDADEVFVTKLAETLGLDFYHKTADVRALSGQNKLSLEEAGRIARREFLLRTSAERGCASIATGHHGDDQAETVLLRLIRGAGVRGLAAIEPSTGEGFIRPLLECGRRELRCYLKDRRLAFREDPSNLDRSFLRNRIRHDLMPVLERDFNPSIARVLRRTSANMAGIESLLSSIGAKALEDVLKEQTGDMMSLDSRRLRAYDKVAWGYVFRRAYETLAGDSKSLTRNHIEAFADLVAGGRSGTEIHLPGAMRAAIEYGTVLIRRHKPRRISTGGEKDVLLPGLTPLPDAGGVLEASLVGAEDLPSDLTGAGPAVEFFDVEGISTPLKVRARQQGDRIRPFGSGGTKKLKDLLIDLKIPQEKRDRLPVLTDGLGLLWVVGLKRSDRAKITGNTKQAFVTRWRADN